MGIAKTIDISKLSEAQQNLFKSLFEQFCEKSEQKEETNPCGLKNGDEYYYITNDGQIGIAKWQGRASDLRRLALGNVFKTEKDTEFAIEKQKVNVELQRYAEEHNGTASTNRRYLIRYEEDEKRLLCDTLATAKIQGTVMFTSRDVLADAIEAVGKERIIKYIFGGRK